MNIFLLDNFLRENLNSLFFPAQKSYQSPISSPPIEVSTDSIESEKVRRLCRFGQNLPLSERIQPENLFPFTSVQWTPTAAETSD